MAHLFKSGRRSVPSLGSLALASVRHAPAIYRTYVALTLQPASKLILDTKNPAYRAVAAVRSEASGYWRTVTLPFPEAGIRLLPQNALGMFASTMQTYRERLQEAARELANQYDHGLPWNSYPGDMKAYCLTGKGDFR